MHPVFKWLIGLKQLPQEAGEGAWHLELQSLPQGMTALLVLAVAVAAVVIVWQLYRWEARNLSVGIRMLIGGLRLLTLACVAMMLCDIVLVIDQTAITLCRENSLPLIVLNIHRPGAFVAAIRGERVGTLVR